jgi:hypothetical protein
MSVSPYHFLGGCWREGKVQHFAIKFRQSSKKGKGKLKEKGNPLKEGSVFLTFPFLQKIEKSLLFPFCTLWKLENSLLFLYFLFR